MKKTTGMNPKASFGKISQQAAGHYTLRFAGLFNLPIPLRYAFGIGVSAIKPVAALILFFCASLMFSSNAVAKVYIDIDSPSFQQFPIAIGDFQSPAGSVNKSTASGIAMADDIK
jgi:hypothetical protein